MKNLEAIYKFSYPNPKNLPVESYIHELKMESESPFFYQLEANRYISLDVLLKAYCSQILRVSIGQLLLLIQLMYEKLCSVYLTQKQQIGKISVENIYIETDEGFSGQITPQKNWQILFLNHYDTNFVPLTQNLAELSLIQNDIWKKCRETEFRLRAKNGENSLEIQQIINVLDQIIFYEVQETLYHSCEKLGEKINEFVDQETQETQYEYLQEDCHYIQDNFDQIIKYLNEVSDLKQSQTEFQQHKMLLQWQQCLYDQFTGYYWNKQSYEYVEQTIKYVEDNVINNTKISEEKKKRLENKFFLDMEKLYFFNFNSPKVRLSAVISTKKDIKNQLENKKPEDFDQLVKQIFDEIGKKKQDKVEPFRQELTQFYSKNCQNRYRLYNRYHFTINIQQQWNQELKQLCTTETIEKEEKGEIKVEDVLKQRFEQLLEREGIKYPVE